jgi:hypothetical protein
MFKNYSQTFTETHELCKDRQLTDQNKNPVRSNNKTFVMETKIVFITSGLRTKYSLPFYSQTQWMVK